MGRIGCHGLPARAARSAGTGLTLIELLVVLALVALVTGMVALSARPSLSSQLQREGERLAVWLESARAQARVENKRVQGRVVPGGVELWGATPPGAPRPQLAWLSEDTLPAPGDVRLVLGPEPILPAQSLRLTSQAQPELQVLVVTSGVGPWRVLP